VPGDNVGHAADSQALTAGFMLDPLPANFLVALAPTAASPSAGERSVASIPPAVRMCASTRNRTPTPYRSALLHYGRALAAQ
jgi:hypothetical protein